jgi:cobalt/nickel transport system permease protein
VSARPATPQWLLEAEVGLCPCGCIGKRRKGSFLEKTIRGATGVLRAALFNEEIAKLPGLLQRVDPRAKLVSLVLLLLAAGLARNVEVLIALYVATVALAVASRLSLVYFVKRVWLFIPIFTGIVAIPAMFSFVTPGEVVVGLGHWFGHEVGLTRQGLTGAALLVLRVATSSSLVILLTLTTPWPRLLAALRALFVPQLFVLVIGMAYRYIFVLLASVDDMYVSRKARTVRTGKKDTRNGQRFVGASAGALFGKAHELSEEVHQAMLARGFTGEAKTLDRFVLRAVDVAWVAAAAVLFVLAVTLDHRLGV